MRLLAYIVLALLGGVTAHAIEVGDTRTAVIAELGSPIGELDLGDRERLMFAAGNVTLVNGVVQSFDIKSAAQLERQEVIAQQIAAQWAERNAAELAESIDKGRAQLDYFKLSSTKLTDQDIKSLMAHWIKIRNESPEADITAEYDATLALAEARADEIARNREEQRITELERRVANAEQRAAAAQQQGSYSQQVSYTYPAWYYPPAPRSVVVVTGSGVITGGGGNCYPQRPVRQPGLSASYTSDNFSVSYSSGYGSGYNRIGSRFVPQSRPITITQTGQ
ncbi:hypothetical protein [Cerasicoccus arenae]|nr:hypothetical protein [Cerasicoccus arenae]MBK1858824.1 hypothetical protein [Cerasicoccus arenae]